MRWSRFSSLRAAISFDVETTKGRQDAKLVEEVSRKFILKMRRGVKNREPQSCKKGAGLLSERRERRASSSKRLAYKSFSRGDDDPTDVPELFLAIFAATSRRYIFWYFNEFRPTSLKNDSGGFGFLTHPPYEFSVKTMLHFFRLIKYRHNKQYFKLSITRVNNLSN